jgi:uncharacterized protein with PIN domain
MLSSEEEAPVKLACDEMLGSLARWLRAAGYDTALAAGGLADEALLALCREEGRVLVTKDRRLVARTEAEGTPAVLLAGDELAAHAHALTDRLGIDWGFAPFTRCQLDNTLLRPATPDEIARMPASARKRPGPFRACLCCGRLYWPGSHVRRMQARLDALARDPA